MINITNEIIYRAHIINSILRVANPSAVGVSTGGYGTIVHLPDAATIQQQSDAQSILTNFDSLTVNADKTTMNEGDADPVVTVSSADAELGYIVLMDGEDYDSGDVSVVSGTATLNLISPVAGDYEIFMYRQTDDYASGSVNITVSEV